ncbi:MAG: zf-HC2 domain-containing protein [Cyanobacteria bacterium SIG29]|nr:zf-HC2 domain-containing protein [Cyanobacteria bacterium SIG29]
MIDKSTCKKVVSMLSLYVENKLDIEDKIFVENHFIDCSDCYQKYLQMKEIINNLHFEYEKLLSEFEQIEAGKTFNIREYEVFYQNISPYIDDELCYDESIKFRKYLLKSKPARAELASAYVLKNNIKQSFMTYKNNLSINYSKKIIKKLKEETRDSFDNVYRRAAVMLGIMLTSLVIVSIFVGFTYFNDFFQKTPSNIVDTIEIPNESEMIEVFFDDDTKELLTVK